MAEYFDISLILKKGAFSKERVFNFLEQFGLLKGENETAYFEGRKVVVSSFEDEEADFHEISIGFSEQNFHEDSFEEELKPFTALINKCFEFSNDIIYALCSYELNGYLIGCEKRIDDFKNILGKFPIVYMRNERTKIPDMVISLKAQELFK